MSIFADEQEDLIDFGDGYQIGVMREMSAGTEVDVERYLHRATAEGMSAADADHESYMLVVEGMVTRIITPSGEIPATLAVIRRLRASMLRRLLAEVNARLAPPKAEASTSAPISISGA